MNPSDRALGEVVREESGRLVASLARWCNDLGIAEDAVAGAIEAALVDWRANGIPRHPDAWLHAVARRRALDQLRRARRYADKIAVLEATVSVSPPEPVGSIDGDDDRIPLLFACCHPALGRDAQIALTMRAVIGLTTREIARAFLLPEATVAQRIWRAKHKIATNAIPLGVPPPERRTARLDEVLTVLYLTYNEAHLATAGDAGYRRDLAEDAIWLARLVDRSLPDQPEVLGLLALLLLSNARADARFDASGELVALADQDRSRWDHPAIAEGIALVERAAALHRPDRFQLQAAIAAVHAEAATYADTDWPQVVALYDLLRRHDDSPVVRLNRAVAVAHVSGPAEALADVEALRPRLDGYHLFHATRAHLLRLLDRPAEARLADERALALTSNTAERSILASRLGPA